MSIRFKSALFHALIAAGVVYLCGMILLSVVKHKRTRDLVQHCNHVAKQISDSPAIREYLLEQNNPAKAEEIRVFLQGLITGNPFLSELILVGPFHKVLFHVTPEETPGPQDGLEDPAFSSPEKVAEGDNASYLDDVGEFLVPLGTDRSQNLGWLRLHWNEIVTKYYYRSLGRLILTLATVSFCLTFFLSYFVLLRFFTGEHHRLTVRLSKIISGHYAQRVDPQTFSREAAEVGTYVNRILTELEESKKKLLILEDNVKQAEKNHTDSLQHLDSKTRAIEAIYTEMRTGLQQLFSLMWCGVMILDDEYRVHWINEPAERLLRFARQDEDILEDERLRRCLSPLIKLNKTGRIDDLCVWPQASLNRPASCRVRANKIPSMDGSKLFFVLLQEESGYPKQRGSDHFSQRLVMEILPCWNAARDSEASAGESSGKEEEWGYRLNKCVERLQRFYRFERGQYGPSQSLRLSTWLRDHYASDDLFSEYLHVMPSSQESEVSLTAPEPLLVELLDTSLEMISAGPVVESQPCLRSMSIRTGLNARGKPVIEIIVPEATRHEAAYFKDAFGNRWPLSSDQSQEGGLLPQFEQDIRLTLFQLVRQILKVSVECVYSAGKKLAIIRLTVDQHTFATESSPTSAEKPPENVESIVRHFLGAAG